MTLSLLWPGRKLKVCHGSWIFDKRLWCLIQNLLKLAIIKISVFLWVTGKKMPFNKIWKACQYWRNNQSSNSLLLHRSFLLPFLAVPIMASNIARIWSVAVITLFSETLLNSWFQLLIDTYLQQISIKAISLCTYNAGFGP